MFRDGRKANRGLSSENGLALPLIMQPGTKFVTAAIGPEFLPRLQL
jgi:hypothetical protein